MISGNGLLLFVLCARRSNFSLKTKENLLLRVRRGWFFPSFAVFPSSLTPQLSLVGWFLCKLGNTGCQCLSVCEPWCWHVDIWKLPVAGIAVPELACDTGNELMESQVHNRTASKLWRLWRGMAGTAGSQNTWRRENFPSTNLFCFLIVC